MHVQVQALRTAAAMSHSRRTTLILPDGWSAVVQRMPTKAILERNDEERQTDRGYLDPTFGTGFLLAAISIASCKLSTTKDAQSLKCDSEGMTRREC